MKANTSIIPIKSWKSYPLSYDYHNCFTDKVNVGIILTMNATQVYNKNEL